MNKAVLIAALAVGAATASLSPAQAHDGCGPGFHRGPYGHCRPNEGPGGVVIAPGGPVFGVYYAGHGDRDGHRYWAHRDQWQTGWRFR